MNFNLDFCALQAKHFIKDFFYFTSETLKIWICFCYMMNFVLKFNDKMPANFFLIELQAQDFSQYSLQKFSVYVILNNHYNTLTKIDTYISRNRLNVAMNHMQFSFLIRSV